MKKINHIVVLLLGCLLMLYPLPVAHGLEEARIGILFAKTGEAAPIDIQGIGALRWAAEKVNQKGGVLGRPIRLLEYDTQSTALGSRQAAREAVADGVLAGIGASWSSHTMAIGAVFQEAGIPLISPASTNPAVTRIGDCIFRVCSTDLFMGRVMASFSLHHLGADKAVILTNASNQYSRDLASYFREAFSEFGKVLWEGDYTRDSTDYSNLLNRVKELNPDVVFIPGYPRDSGFILKQADKMGIRPTFLGGDGWNYRMSEYAGDSVNGNFFTDHWHRGIPIPESKAFIEQYEGENEDIKIGLIPLAHDAMMVLADAMNRSGDLDSVAIRQALASTRGFRGATGSISFDGNGDPVKSAIILKFEDNQPKFHMVVNP